MTAVTGGRVPYVPARFGDDPTVCEMVTAETGDAAFGEWAQLRWPHGGFSLFGAQEEYRRHVTSTAVLCGGLALTRAEVRTLMILLGRESAEQAAHPEVVKQMNAPRLWELAAKLKMLTEAPGMTAGAAYRLTAQPASPARSQEPA